MKKSPIPEYLQCYQEEISNLVKIKPTYTDEEIDQLMRAMEHTKEQRAQLEEAEQKNAELTQKLAQMQQTITQTTENIDDVVAKLEKVLKENGASDNNN